jgi:hypothetical protein
MDSDPGALALLEYGADQGEGVAAQFLEFVQGQRPTPTVIFQSAALHELYLEAALARLSELPDDHFHVQAFWLVALAEGITGEPPDLLVELVGRIDPAVVPDFDEGCALFARFVRWGLADVVLRFAADDVFGRRFVAVLLPAVAGTNPVFCLRLVMAVMRFRNAPRILLEYDALAWIQAAIEEEQWDVAGQAALRIAWPPMLLADRAPIAGEFARALEETDDEAGRTGIALTLLPFIVAGVWKPTENVIRIVKYLLQADDTAQAARALAVAVVAAQDPVTAARFAGLDEIELIYRFLKSGAPPHFIYTAIRFFLALAPFLSLEADDGTIADAVAGIVEVGLESGDRPRIALVALQALNAVPRETDWNGLIKQAGLEKLTAFVAERFAADAAVVEASDALQLRFRK